ncbi:helix-hairpin-helix domain-containing protein [Pseudoramibacter sp.]|jgi:competence protein ComEA|uniref:helix-hairpin-helix domain-containing protein n=1 Tax=Pseudoramibacter sp. TaxID=2034862 RepID=UPI0025D4B6A8|nr:helix-hairpin-helix domain-containing protein [Pseudoramibacter sp.]MCH4073002.1 helix-hairpin-helix domain-containing protein [Pseudoramibacter sp.]MCH4106773.1 helix-hairpin-helix domain-containing protein [Pseudoramibacter sp.]
MDKRSESQKRQKTKAAVCVAIIGLLILVYGVRTYQKNELLLSKSTVKSAQSSDSENQASKIYVQVTGAVNQPGVYQLKNDSRGIDAVNAAKGLTEEADGEAVNLATKLKDGQKLNIPTKTQTQQNQSSGTTAAGTININTASKEELMTLPGIGEVLAQNIIDYRTKNGAFSDPSEIKNVNRIGDKLYEQIKDRIAV